MTANHPSNKCMTTTVIHPPTTSTYGHDCFTSPVRCFNDDINLSLFAKSPHAKIVVTICEQEEFRTNNPFLMLRIQSVFAITNSFRQVINWLQSFPPIILIHYSMINDNISWPLALSEFRPQHEIHFELFRTEKCIATKITHSLTKWPKRNREARVSMRMQEKDKGYGRGGKVMMVSDGTRGSLGPVLGRSVIQIAAARGGSGRWCLAVTSPRETSEQRLHKRMRPSPPAECTVYKYWHFALSLFYCQTIKYNVSNPVFA